MSFLSLILEDLREDLKGDRPIAVIIKGNPRYLEDPKVSKQARAFYKEIKEILVERGYKVKTNAGEEFTTPDENAAVWIGHSRGIDRLQYAPKGVKTIELQTLSHGRFYPTKAAEGLSEEHYKLSWHDRKQLKAL